MKLTMTIEVDPQDIRQLVAMLTGEVVTDEDIKKHYEDAPPVPGEILESKDVKLLVISAYAMRQFGGNESDKKPKSKFSQRLEEAQKLQKDRHAKD